MALMDKIKTFFIALWKIKKEIITYTATVIGWALLTWGLADLFGIWVYKVSGGLFSIGFSIGYKPLIIHLYYGFYGLYTEVE